MANHVEQFERLFTRYWDRTVRFIISLGIPREDARDLAQETFVRVYRNMEQYRHEAEWSYIQTTARRLVLNRVRDQAAAKRNKGLTVSADDAMLPDLPDKNPSPEEIAALRESLARSLAAVQRLPKIYRDCILWYLAGYSYVEIAQILGIPEATVKSRLHEARQDLEIE